jgi:PHD/YefM family antitoxin component YafN of YafNO toxin-antitoxin module
MRVETGRKLHDSRPPRLNLSLRRLRSRNDTEYLLSNPVMAARLMRALEDSRAGRSREFTMQELYARYGLDPKGEEIREMSTGAHNRVLDQPHRAQGSTMRREQKRAMRLRREARRGSGVPRFPLPRRWRDTTTMLLSNPVNAKILMDAIAQLDYWAAVRGRGTTAHDDAA